MPAFDPVVKNLSSPRCLNELITVRIALLGAVPNDKGKVRRYATRCSRLGTITGRAQAAGRLF
jgi:hypothetical protein